MYAYYFINSMRQSQGGDPTRDLIIPDQFIEFHQTQEYYLL